MRKQEFEQLRNRLEDAAAIGILAASMEDAQALLRLAISLRELLADIRDRVSNPSLRDVISDALGGVAMKPQPGLLARKTLAVTRHNVLTVPAWLDCPEPSAEVEKIARAALRELTRDLKITAVIQIVRKAQMGIEEAQR